MKLEGAAFRFSSNRNAVVPTSPELPLGYSGYKFRGFPNRQAVAPSFD